MELELFNQLLTQTKAVRVAQKNYFANRGTPYSNDLLNAAKKLEKELDQLIKVIDAQNSDKKQKSLFE